MSERPGFIHDALQEEPREFIRHFRDEAEADPSRLALLRSSHDAYRQAGANEQSRAAATLFSIVAEAVFKAHPKTRTGVWKWDALENITVNGLSRVGGPGTELEHAARNVSTLLFRVGMGALGVDDFQASQIMADAKPHFLSSEFLHEWHRTRRREPDEDDAGEID